MEVTAEYKAIFAEEARENMSEWEAALLELEHSTADQDLINTIFRAIHTLKGSAGFIGLDKLQRVSHELESRLQRARDAASELDAATLELLFRGLDLCRGMVDNFSAGKMVEEDVDAFLAEVGALGESPQSPTPIPAEGGPAVVPDKTVQPEAYAGSRRFKLELVVQASGKEAYLRAFLIRRRLQGLATIISEDPPPEVLKDSAGRFAYTLTIATDLDETAIRRALNIGQLEIASMREVGEEPEKHKEKEKSTQAEARVEEVVRVSVQRLDHLLNLVGELVIQNSSFISIAEQLKGRYGKNPQIQELEEKTEGLANITRDLQDGIMKVRMLPVNNVFSRFHRVVRDLAKHGGKEVNLEVFGGETEIDKKVMDRIGDPLVHLVRNAVDHGIEPREQRLAAGKAPAGLLRLGAYQDGDHICIEVSDDGRGLDKEAVLAKAVEKGLVSSEESSRLSNEQILGLIFLPGFSTAREVTEVSGRGVGMDVVKRTVQALNGNVRVRSSRFRGTTVTISLPLTMAIIPALLVEVGDSTFAIPLSSVKEVLKISAQERQTVGGRNVIRLREQVLAMVHLREALGIGASSTEKESRQPVVIVDYEEKRIGLGVDQVLGNREIVIKSLSRHYREIEGLIGASIMGDGRIALIVDVETLIRQHYHVAEEEQGIGRVGSVSLQMDEISGASSDLTPAAAPWPENGAAASLAKPESLVAEMRALGGGAIEQIHNEGAIQASIAFSQMSGREVRVSFPESQLIELGNVAGLLGGEESAVCGIHVGIIGDLAGSILMVLPEGNLPRFHELLYRLPPGSCGTIAEVDLSGLSELGNVLSACFINALANGTRLHIRSRAPEVSVDMCQAVIDAVLARFNRPGEKLLLTKALLYLGDSQQVVCHLLLFLEPESLRRLLDLLSGVEA